MTMNQILIKLFISYYQGRAKKKLEELLHQWSEWDTLECSISELTDFGLSKVGLINSTDDVSGPAVSGTSLLGDNRTQSSLSSPPPSPSMSATETQQERHKNRSAVGQLQTIWHPRIFWEMDMVYQQIGEHPQMIFDNILNRNIPWPAKILTRDLELGEQPRKKAAFVPSSESALDISYFTSRYTWNNSEQVRASSSVLGFVCTFLFNSFKQTHKKHSIFPITFKVYNVGMEATVVLQLKGDCSLGYLHIVSTEEVLEYFRQQR
ncbi:unnamed protein product [Lactuca saligna]|uniref:Uncharacterized protein n=1 Tax=Lactuca saligna TaxID=75948 RepID=A0AA35YFK9_LACSI|nr:unnamed protein product [Lactuca saligna]